MRVFGTIKDASKEIPLSHAKVSLCIGEKELAVLYSDSKGKFEHQEEASYIGETLFCQVEKEEYHSQKVSHAVEQERVPLEIELVSIKEEKIDFKIKVKDEEGNSLGDVSVVLKVNGKEVASGISDNNGLFKIALSSDLKGKTLSCQAALKDFGLEKSHIQLDKETALNITMKRQKFEKIWWILGGLIALESLFLGEPTILINNIILIPLVSCALAFFKPVNWPYAALFPCVLQLIAFIGFGFGGGRIVEGGVVAVSLLFLANAGICALISSGRLKRIKKEQ